MMGGPGLVGYEGREGREGRLGPSGIIGAPGPQVYSVVKCVVTNDEV